LYIIKEKIIIIKAIIHCKKHKNKQSDCYIIEIKADDCEYAQQKTK